jgi:hypothetical protein
MKHRHNIVMMIVTVMTGCALLQLFLPGIGLFTNPGITCGILLKPIHSSHISTQVQREFD